MFWATIDKETLQEIVNVIGSVVDEAALSITTGKMHYRTLPDGTIDGERTTLGAEIRVMDGAHVVMIVVKMQPNLFGTFEADDEQVLGIDLDKLKQILKDCYDGQDIELSADSTKHLTVRAASSVHVLDFVDPAGMAEPKVPNLNLPARFKVPMARLQKATRKVDAVSDHLTVRVTPEGALLSAHDTDAVVTDLMPLNIECSKAVQSSYPADYFSNMVKAIPGWQIVEVQIGQDYPIRLKWSLKDGAGTVTYMLAPRIDIE